MWRPSAISRILLGAVSLVAVLFSAGLAQNTPLHLDRVKEPIKLDGHVTDEEWGHVAPLPLVVYQPVFEADPSVDTEIRVAYDDEYLYVSGRLYETAPSNVRANSLYRDRYSGDDTFAIILDTFNDNETGLWFFTTPNEVRVDMALSNDVNFGSGGPFGGVINDSWNTYWDVATQVTDEGWFAEMRIPFSSLGFQDVDGRVEMGMSTYRYIARLSERHLFPAIPPNWDVGFAKPSQLRKVVLNGVYAQKPVYVTPYGLAGPNRTSELNDAETEYIISDDTRREVGLDVKYNLTSNLTADLTVNTDFAQVEADEQQVNLTRFSLFFPEKRQFFQERSAIFEFNYGLQDRLFHSRRIGVFEGEIIPIYGGARLVGRLGSWDVGVLDMHTFESSELPSENFGVARVRRRIINPFSTAGALLTTRVGVDGAYNLAYGLDAIVRVTGDEYATLKVAQTAHDSLEFDQLESSLIFLGWERRTVQGLAYNLLYQRSGRTFESGMGFESRDNITLLHGSVKYGWFAPTDSPVRILKPSVFTSNYFRNEDGTVESAFTGGAVEAELKTSAIIGVNWEWSYEDIRKDTLEFPEDTGIPPGTYRFVQFNGSYVFPEGALFRGSLGVKGGTFYDGTSFSVAASPVWNLSRHLELSGFYDLTVADFPDRAQAFTVHLARLRAQIGFNTKASLAAFVQFNSADDVFAANVRFRYNFREGRDLWLVYNEGLNTDRFSTEPVKPQTDFRTVLVKYTHTFAM